jgi:uncharacterized protein YkwD
VTRLVRRAVATVALLTAGFGSSLALSAAPASAATSKTTIENQVRTLINQQRVAHGCRSLTVDSKLVSVAEAHSADMVAHNLFSHTGSNGSTPASRIESTGFRRAYGENIAWGQRTASAVVTAWMNSAPHRANILNCAFYSTGVGVAYKSDGTPYWTQDFGRS